MIKKKYPEVITIYESHTYELRGEELYNLQNEHFLLQFFSLLFFCASYPTEV